LVKYFIHDVMHGTEKNGRRYKMVINPSL